MQLRETGSEIVEIDYNDEGTIKAEAADLQEKGVSLDALINCGGTSYFHTHIHTPETSFGSY